ncbi:helix-turn-helix domain-containing protein [Novosphingobium fuchskuhlense]|uniref:helix-turn-helix domain-containing protein n=1 Tax=Novosphingobium fuchskuhlense TaxID=1117702 RepID=UPI0014700417|nr:helix-turn-helix domain-containing protein [Novosphingobium fuchskuhlense]
MTEDGERDMIVTDSTDGSDARVRLTADVGDYRPLSVAERLVEARRSLGLTNAEVAVRTRVTLRHIEALEAGDYSAMPGRPYAIGFARAYARAVGLPDTEIVCAVRSELEGTSPRPESGALNQFEVGDPAKTPSRLIGWLALLMVGALLAMGGIFWRSYYAPSVALPSLVPDRDQKAAQVIRNQQAAQPQMAVQPHAPSNGPVVFVAMEEGIWVKFYDDRGKQLMQKQLAKGESYTVPADASGPKLWTGRPDALSITVGGTSIPRLSDSEQVMKDVPVDAVSLRTRSLTVPSQAAPKPTPAP